MITVESAIAIMAFILMLAVSLSAISTAIDHLKCTDAAREAARLTARGEPEKAKAAAESIAPKGATTTITTTADEIHVTVTATQSVPLIPGLTVEAEAYAITEPTPAPVSPDPLPSTPNAPNEKPHEPPTSP